MGYFGFSYLEENSNLLREVEIDGGAGRVAPSIAAAQNGEYQPLSRPLLVYGMVESIARPGVQTFMRSYVENEQTLAETALYVPLTEEELTEAEKDLDAAIEQITS